MTPESEAASQRCDIWLFRARLFKSRALAAEAISAGRVRIERFGQVQRLTRAAALVRAGDRLVFTRGGDVVRIAVLALAERRGPPAEARGLYEAESGAG
ncbi:RNA-binding S4 domain-containing protein [Hyphomonadaceae bacterium ML37]|nr:RNA-binding S4 domain-containing protein [Hyphomonadaceae bacterium ML37]